MNRLVCLMKPSFALPRVTTVALGAVLISLAATVDAAQTATNAPAKSAAAAPPITNAAPVAPDIPKSVFVIPAMPQQGRDPFYPTSMRLFASAVYAQTNTTVAAPPQVELQLKALSGTPGHRLAIINNHTFEDGEEGEVMTASGRARVRCLQIKEESVLVQVGGEQRLLRLRPGI